jgi:tetratricopeptide (TPR) repeat protein
MGRYEEGIKYLEEAAMLLPDDPTILEHLGDAYVKMNYLKKGIGSYRKAIKNKADDIHSLQQKIDALERQLGKDG